MRYLIVMGALAFTAPAMAAEPAAPPPPCQGAPFQQMDFWQGDWNATWKGGTGSNHITKTYGGCVIEEHFDGTPGMHLKGHSVSTYFAPAKEWRQTWVDNEGSYIDLRGGPDGKGGFVLTTIHDSGKPPRARMIFEDIKKDSFTWRWQHFKDGKVWEDNWVIHYTRQKS